MDLFDSEKRSDIMRAVKSKGNKSTEIRLIRIFRKLGIKGWRRNYKAKGHPDFVFLKPRIAVFVDGCFWHGHSCRKMPGDNREYWERKIGRNRERDSEITELYESRGWKVIRIWECDLMTKNRDRLLQKFLPLLQSSL